MKEINRRQFLKASAAAGTVLMAGNILKGGSSMAYASVKIPEIEKLTMTVITDNYYDCLRWNEKIATRTTVVTPNMTLHAEHGLSYYIETVLNGKSYNFMFDYGWDFQGVSRNLDLLDIDLRKLDALALSHGHLDHHGNLIPLLQQNKAKFRKGIPLYVGKEAFSRRWVNFPKKYAPVDGWNDLGQLNREDLENLRIAKVVEVKEPTEVVPGAYLTGNIERVTEYEKGSPILFIDRGGKRENDIFPGEQSLVFNVKGKGLVVVSACAHAGIVNTVKHAQKMTGVDKVHVAIGGFHLVGAPPAKINATIAGIKAIGPDYIVPMHCSGWEAITSFQNAMPKEFVLNMAGTKYIISA
ncbi:MAG: twin-arginine translocation signal domain-containing protein [Desulfobacteraceae bacterium]|nr:twin-arginine translocation signal domain-containing protein [Desulfobacteraceae bacterium]